ncbi:MAG: hypothetical protein QM813_23115 [Verrucomicrobiota bacterium]
MLIVARLDGPTPEIARALVDKALQAEPMACGVAPTLICATPLNRA